MKKILQFIIFLTGIIIFSQSGNDLYAITLNEGFSQPSFPPLNWTLEFSNVQYWFRESVSSYGIGEGSAIFDFYDAEPSTVQSLITLTFTNTLAGDSLIFDHAYATYQTEIDQLQIETSANGGATYTTFIVLDGGVSGPLVTAPPTQDPFGPDNSQWATKKFGLPAGTNKIKFKAISAFGNNLYLDSIRVKSVSTGIHNITQGSIPEHYSLSQNYPNPFNPNTTINYQCSMFNYVTLKIYDALGNEIVTLINEKKTPGSYTTEFDGSNFASGIYFYKLVSGDFTETKRMILVK